jgi:antitoxin (DNA-binding transcriptional repressor) of toxin-antitoxin stability system
MRNVRISSTELARSIGDILGRVRFKGESFVIERNGKDVALLTPLPEAAHRSLRDVLSAWVDAGERDPEFADQLEALDREDLPPEDPRGPSSTPAS